MTVEAASQHPDDGPSASTKYPSSTSYISSLNIKKREYLYYHLPTTVPASSTLSTTAGALNQFTFSRVLPHTGV